MALLDKRKPFPDAYNFFRKAFEQDPEYGAAYALAAFALMMQQYVNGVPMTAALRTEAVKLADLGAKVSADDAVALSRAGHVLAYLGHEFDRGATMIEHSISLNPNLAVAWQARGWVSIMCGEPDRAIESFEIFTRLAPHDKGIWSGIAFAHFSLGQYEDGCIAASRALAFFTNILTLVAYIINAALAGREADARRAAQQLLELNPNFRASHSKEVFSIRSLTTLAEMETALRLVGVPE